MKWWYCLGTIWSQVCWGFFSASLIANWVKVVVFHIWERTFHLWASCVDATTVPFIVPFFQSSSGLVMAREGYYKIILSLLRLVTKNWSFLVCFWCHISSSTFYVILPDLLRLPSTFLAVLGHMSGVVGMLNFLMSWWWMKFSVALLSTSA